MTEEVALVRNLISEKWFSDSQTWVFGRDPQRKPTIGDTLFEKPPVVCCLFSRKVHCQRTRNGCGLFEGFVWGVFSRI